MAIVKYVENDETFWRVYVHIRSRTNKSKRFQKSIFNLKSEAEAKREEKKYIRQLSMEAQKYDGEGLCWIDIIELWWQEVKAGYLGSVSQRSAEGYLSIIKKWTSHWNGVQGSAIGRADAKILLNKLEQSGLSRSYQKKVKNIINKVYEWGMEFGYISGVKNSPLKGITIDKGEEKVPDILSLEEIKKFLTAANAVGHQWYPIWAFAVLTGMRSGELHALTWDQIDMEKNLILVDRSYDSNVKKIGPTKARYWRTIPINPSLRKLILDLKMNPVLISQNHVLPRIKDWDNGDQAMPLKNFLKSINLKPIKFHALRACFATQMLANGVPSPIVMKIGGWKKSATMDIYLRLAGVDTKGATDCLQFVPEEICFGGNVVNFNSARER
jgi:integrase